jgi:hypothetical protein
MIGIVLKIEYCRFQMTAIPTVSHFLSSLTTFKFIAMVTEDSGVFDDLEHGYYSQWIIRAEDGSQVAAIAMNNQQPVYSSKIEVGQEYVFCNGIFCEECMVGVIIDDLPVPFLYVLTPKTRLLPVTPNNRKGVVTLASVIERYTRLEFRGSLELLTAIDTEWDEENPTFTARLTDAEGGKIQIQAEGPEVCKNVHPLLLQKGEFVFRGGRVKMRYAPKSMEVEWTDKTTAERYVAP